MRNHPLPQMTPMLWLGLLYMSTFTTLIAMLMYGYGGVRFKVMCRRVRALHDPKESAKWKRAR